MNAKVRILDTGACTMLELDGKSMGKGIDKITYVKEAGESAVLTIRISSVDSFEFLPDGEIDRAMGRVSQIAPPETVKVKIDREEIFKDALGATRDKPQG